LKTALANENQELSPAPNALKRDYERIVARPGMKKPFKIVAALNYLQDASINETLDASDDVLHSCAPPSLCAPPISESEHAKPKAPYAHL
jgi:hypothetical protein